MDGESISKDVDGLFSWASGGCDGRVEEDVPVSTGEEDGV